MTLLCADSTLLDTIAQIELLKHWGVPVLASGRDADESDLAEIINIRCGIDKSLADLGEEVGSLFFSVLKVDKMCMAHAPTLLYLSREAAVEAAQGGKLREVSWYGVHNWAITRVLGSWTEALNRGGLSAHPAEVLQAYTALSRDLGPIVVNEAFYDAYGAFSEDVRPEYREQLQELVLQSRSSS